LERAHDASANLYARDDAQKLISPTLTPGNNNEFNAACGREFIEVGISSRVK